MKVSCRDLKGEGLRELHLEREAAYALDLGINVRIAATVFDGGFQITIDRHLGAARIPLEQLGDRVAYPAMPGGFLMTLILRRAGVVGDKVASLIPWAIIDGGTNIVLEQRDIPIAGRLRANIDRALAQTAPRQRPLGFAPVSQIDFSAQMLPRGRLHRHERADRDRSAR
ncbi:hypothetical protein [Sphingomonas soli]|uniref:hypothetical protein n=1 Tax=Sphingomonas soli TaxID=266127 RepID=UPI0034E226AD